MTNAMKGHAHLLAIVVFGLALLQVGCGTEGSGEVIDIAASNLPVTAGTDSTGHWQSSAWNADWIRYEGETSLRLEHNLGRVPSAVLVYISFSPDGHAAGLSAGDSARMIAVTETHLTIQNALRENFYVRVVLQ